MSCHTRLVIWRSHVWSPTGAVGEVSSGKLTFCFDCYYIPLLCYHCSMQTTLIILPKVQVAGYSETCIHPWCSEVRVGWLCCPSIGLKPIKVMNSHAIYQGMLIHSHRSHLAEPLWTDPDLKSRVWRTCWFSVKKKKSCRWGLIYQTVPHNPCMQGKSHTLM